MFKPSNFLHKNLFLTLFKILTLNLLLKICKTTFVFQNYDLTSTTLDPKKSGFSLTGTTSSSDYLGYAVSTAGDINNDGYADIIIGAHNSDMAYVLYGGPTSSLESFALSTDSLDHLTTGFSIKGAVSGDGFGYAVASAGDIDNDGYDDIVIGAQMKDSSRGAVYVIYGNEKENLLDLDLSTMTLDPATTGFTLYGETAGDTFGYAVNPAGDVDKDGYDDIIIGGFGKNTNTGVAYVVYGGPKGSFQDIDLSTDSLDPMTTGFRILGNASPDQFGYSASTAGDFNKDGYADILIAGYRKNNFQGMAYLIYGGERANLPNLDLSTDSLDPATTGFWIQGNLAGDYFGRVANYAGDVNQDGYADIIIGAYRKDTYQGIVYVIYGKPISDIQNIDLSTTNLDPASTGFTIRGSAINTGFGVSAGFAGDINKDGYADLIIGGYKGGLTDSSAFVVYGGSSLQNIDISATALIPASTGFYVKRTGYQSYLGYCVNTAGDVNNDGFDDIIIGAYGGAGQIGTAYIIHNGCLTEHCTTCEERVCTLCDDGYGLDTNSDCASCPTNCALCSVSSTCETCSTNYFLSQGGCIGTCPDTKYGLNGVCESCIQDCKECSDSSTCDECVSGSYLSNSVCVATCPDSTFASTSSGSCEDCSANCFSCTSYAICGICDDGYTLENSVCVQCPNNCDKCSTSTTCDVCTSPYLLYQSQCTQTSCPASTFQSSNECKDCSSNCLSCTSATSCLTCEQKYVVENAACSACPTNADLCSDAYTCTSCTTPYLLYQSQCTVTICPTTTFQSGNECKDCSLNCLSCLSEKSCQTCVSGYLLSTDSLCVLPRKPPKTVSQVLASSVTELGSAVAVGSSSVPMNTLISEIVQNTRFINLGVTEKLSDAYKTWNTELISWDMPDILGNVEDDFRPLPWLFSQYSLDSPFLVNFWSTAVTIGVGLSVLLVSITMKTLLQKAKYKGWLSFLVDKLLAGSLNFTLAQAYGCLDDVLFYCVLEFKTNPFNTVFSWGSFFLALVFICMGAGLVWFNVKVIRRCQSHKKNGSMETFKEQNESWELFYADFNDNDAWTQSYLAIQVVRSTMCNFILAVLYHTSMIQATCFLMIDGVMIIFLIAKKPLSSLRATVVQYFYEIVTILVHIMTFILSLEPEDSGGFKSVLCSSMIYLNYAILFSGIGIMLFETFLTIKEAFSVLKEKIKERKLKKTTVNPIGGEDSETQNNLSILRSVSAVTDQSLVLKLTVRELQHNFDKTMKRESSLLQGSDADQNLNRLPISMMDHNGRRLIKKVKRPNQEASGEPTNSQQAFKIQEKLDVCDETERKRRK